MNDRYVGYASSAPQIRANIGLSEYLPGYRYISIANSLALKFILNLISNSLLYALRIRHVLLLVRTIDLLHPRWPIWHVELDRWHIGLERSVVIQDADFHDLCISERRASAPHRAAAVTAKVRSNLIASVVALLRNRLRRAGDHFEPFAWHDYVRTVRRAGDLTAVFAVAECLGKS